MVSERCFGALKSPVQRLGCAPVPCPTARSLESAFYPGAVDIIQAVERALGLAPADLSKETFYSHEQRFKGPF